MDITGHKPREVFDRYNIVSAGDLELAAKKIDERIASRTATNLATTLSTTHSQSKDNKPEGSVFQ